MAGTSQSGFSRANLSELLLGVYVLQAPSFTADPEIGEALRRSLNVCLLVSGGTVTLVDAGLPGILPALDDALRTLELGLGDLRRVIITHSHRNHVGGLPEIVGATGAEVWAHRDDAGVIDGSVAPPDTSALVTAVRSRLEIALGHLPPEKRELVLATAGTVYPTEAVAVDLRLAGGEELGVLGGCRIVHTPGHTPGHLSLHLPAQRLLVAGDLLT
jgi:glyoxylase-like metal-dependent hydrolase (beta-lactamase superfamily II)